MSFLKNIFSWIFGLVTAKPMQGYRSMIIVAIAGVLKILEGKGVIQPIDPDWYKALYTAGGLAVLDKFRRAFK